MMKDGSLGPRYVAGTRVVYDGGTVNPELHNLYGTIKTQRGANAFSWQYYVLLDGDTHVREISGAFLRPLNPPKFRLGTRVQTPNVTHGAHARRWTVVFIEPTDPERDGEVDSDYMYRCWPDVNGPDGNETMWCAENELVPLTEADEKSTEVP